ncbi:phosphogluconate dehydrogenase, NAD binding domain protein [Acetobacteraceae bacterium AT-5844]|nr:phosphogluconate dehydrogenase, NAD binding domain protein [Acetobacteraceae bacterium AT-5844]
MVARQISLGFIGYGEIGSTLGAGLRAQGLERVASYDIGAFEGPYASLIQSRAQAAGVTLVRSASELAEQADIIIGVTPGSASVASAQAFASHLTARHLFIDIASATPKVKLAVAAALAQSGASVADGSIVGTPKDGLALPILASGPAAEAVRDAVVPWGMKIDAVGDKLGTASAIKILRSVLIKGIEALTNEMLLGARRYGLEDVVLASAAKTLSRPFQDLAAGLLTTGVIHARRRSEEAGMAAEALADVGVDPIMSRSTEARLQWVESLGLKEHFGGKVPESMETALAAIEAKMSPAEAA